jgi:RNA polymerase sigma factor (sigma-70 family)
VRHRATLGTGLVLDTPIRELTTAIASGNAEAFARFYRGWFDRAYADARRATGRDESFCLDVVQDAMIRVIRSMRAMDAEPQLRNWLRVVVQSCAYDRLRKEARRKRREETAVPSDRPTERDETTDEQLRWLRNELAGTDTPETRLLLMRYRLGWTLERIGRAVGLTSGAVDGRLRRATNELREKARESFDE